MEQTPSRNPVTNLVLKIAAFIIRAYYSIFGKDYYHRQHLEVTLNGWSLSARCLEHGDYTAEKEAELVSLQEEVSPDEFIHEAFVRCRNCNFLIFDGENGTFVQFWLGNGKIFADWPILKGNKLKKYTYAMFGLLNELGITHDFQHDGHWPKKMPYSYTLVKEKGFDEYIVNFGKDIEKVSQFITLLFTQVFGQKLEDVKLKVG